MAQPSRCFDDDEVLALVERRLPLERAAAANQHLDGCDDCRALVADTARALFDGEAERSTAADPVRAGASPREASFADFDGYRLLKPIGSGAMGKVFLGHDTLLDRLVAIKFIAAVEPDVATRERFRIEARAIARLQHPNVVAIHRVGELDGQPYLISEYVRGKSLAQLELPLAHQAVVRIGLGLARGLAAAHRRGVLHRDLKPANAILDENDEVKLVDFGLAKLESPPALEGAAPPEIVPLAPGDRRASQTVHAKAQTLLEPPLALSPTLVASPQVGAAIADPTLDDDSLPAASPQLTVPGSLVGTPLYMAPEIWIGNAATARSDLYSVGVMLYELCSGRAPHEAPNLARLGVRVMETDAPPLAQAAPAIDARLAAIVDRCLRRDPELRFPSADELCDAFEQLADARAAPLPEGNPYRGLRPFEAEHRALFFGRGRAVRDIVERLRAESFVLVAGHSGVGKSSLCRAGVLPFVSEGGFVDKRRWSSVVMVPGRRPLAALSSILAPHLGVDTISFEDPSEVARALQKRNADDTGLVIFIDQLEELVTVSDRDEAETMGLVLAAIVETHISVRLLATVRGDFLARLADLAGIGPQLARGLYLLRSLPPEGIREAIIGPAKQKGVRFESEALVETLVSTTSDAEGGLPLLQFALAELWEVRGATPEVITAAALDKLGGVAGALARHADGVIAALRPAERVQAQRILAKLVTAAGTRACRGEAELDLDDADRRAALEALIRGRLVVARESDEGTVFEIAHEVLIKGWPALRGWLDGAAESRAVRQRLETATAEWERLKRSEDALWTERQLAELALVDAAELNTRESGFVGASRRALRRGRRRRQAVAIGVMLALGLGYGAVRLRARQELRGRVSLHLAHAGKSVANARQRNREVEDSRTRAFAAFDSDDKNAEQIWEHTLAQSADEEALYTDAGEALETALLLDGTRHDVKQQLVEVLFERALLAERAHRANERDELLRRMRLYDDEGEMQRRWHAPATLSVSSSPAGARVRVERYEADGHGHRQLNLVAELGATPIAATLLPPGSYLLTFAQSGRAEVRYPLLLGRGEQLDVSLDLPERDEVATGFVYVAPGRFLYGASDESLRRAFFKTSPLHERRTAAYQIARSETTFAEWLDYLDHLPAAERERRTPKAAMGLNGSITLQRLTDGKWRIRLEPTTHMYEAHQGEPIIYEKRKIRARQDWLRFPISGVSLDDVQAYLSWRGQNGGPKGARLCTEAEWERGARGADDRAYPNGDALSPDDANFDETYEREPFAMGPDEVGAHPRSRSPFGLDDMAGNVWEFVQSKPDQVIRGGSFYFGAIADATFNREVVQNEIRDSNLGFRLCAGVPK